MLAQGNRTPMFKNSCSDGQQHKHNGVNDQSVAQRWHTGQNNNIDYDSKNNAQREYLQ